MIKKSFSHRCVGGFTLVEMAIVIVILGFVLGALLMPMQVQRQQQAQLQTENTLAIAKRALLGYAQAHGRLPCPATAVSNGIEQPIGGAATCTQAVGFLPAATLGMQPADAQGYALDGWDNRIRYAVTQSSAGGAATPDFTTNIADNAATPLVNEADGMNVVGMSNLLPDLRVCASSVGITAAVCSAAVPETNYLINNAVAVIYSIGATGNQAIGGADETANLNDADANGIVDDGVFVSHEPRSAADANGEFDHIVTWISPYVLYNAMIEAGQLH
ncbi:prepilin-type cleavage/methylation domain-containing protein [Methylotenera oryzisoli]|uniref:Prepilin-type cleavage/methylation domain-containing protein n=1 Tax=Methylotenera oryzisoli TaxID=2080758 RepID=A0A4Y9VQG2_9PROT|nr:type II secretion system protein [Methylotenera oryzisoli]TFW70986.1 prepilin-type cleavage/methylation domain-containing protein [Methylotenera oryzisoli]